MMAIWWAMLVDEIDGRLSHADAGESWLRRLGEQWRAEAAVVFDGVSTMRIDAQVSTERQCQVLLTLAARARDRLGGGVGSAALGPLATRVSGARLGGEAPWRGLRRVADAFVWLLGAGRGSGPGGEAVRQRYLHGRGSGGLSGCGRSSRS